MNIYIRYFDDEALCHNMGEIREYLDSIAEIEVTPKMLDEIAAYAESDIVFPKRYKVTSRNYFIMIKTELESLADFHANAKEKREASGEQPGRFSSVYDQVQEGWYQCEKRFKRVVPVSIDGETPKYEYVETSIEALIYGSTPRECHDQLVEYLKERDDLDARCQYPSLKESNFLYEYKGATLD